MMVRVFGVMGCPISHSLSPRMHQAAFEALKLSAVYAPFEVPPRWLSPILRGLLASGIDGLNVTVPLKEAVVPLLDALDRQAQILGAVNTIVVRGGRTRGYNTDVAGFLRALEELGWRPRPCRAVILGAGGAAKAVAWALAKQPGTELIIANRHLARAQRLARWLRRWRPASSVRAASLSQVTPEGQDLLVNATSLGMKPGDPMPVSLRGASRRMLVYDLVYNRMTPLVARARQQGCVAANGTSMLVYQGAEAFRLWWRRHPPVEAMRRAVELALQKAVHGRESTTMDLASVMED